MDNTQLKGETKNNIATPSSSISQTLPSNSSTTPTVTSSSVTATNPDNHDKPLPNPLPTTSSAFKYKIGKIRQTPPILKDIKTGLEYIKLNPRPNYKLYGVTKFSNCYKSDSLLGKGTFGEVYKGTHLETQRTVAIKKLIINAESDVFPITAEREIVILKQLNHKNVIKLIELIYDASPDTDKNGNSAIQRETKTHYNSHFPHYQRQQQQQQQQQEQQHVTGNHNNFSSSPSMKKSFYMVLPYMIADLSGILHNPRITLELCDIKNMMLQILEGVNYIHCCKYMHRDIKTANILIDHRGVLKIADFGLARVYYGPPPNLRFPGGAGFNAQYTSVVVTRWYRAPELVLGDKHYTTAVDMWGVGCVFAEFFIKKPILQGSTDPDQGHEIFKLLGTPTFQDWPTAKYLPGKTLIEKTSYPSTLTQTYSKYLDDHGLDFLNKLLCLDPYKRITAMAAKSHKFFNTEPLPSKELKSPSEESHEADIARFNKERLVQEESFKRERKKEQDMAKPLNLPVAPRSNGSNFTKKENLELPSSFPSKDKSTLKDYQSRNKSNDKVGGCASKDIPMQHINNDYVLPKGRYNNKKENINKIGDQNKKTYNNPQGFKFKLGQEITKYNQKVANNFSRPPTNTRYSNSYHNKNPSENTSEVTISKPVSKPTAFKKNGLSLNNNTGVSTTNARHSQSVGNLNGRSSYRNKNGNSVNYLNDSVNFRALRTDTYTSSSNSNEVQFSSHKINTERTSSTTNSVSSNINVRVNINEAQSNEEKKNDQKSRSNAKKMEGTDIVDYY
ncbi:related to Serine/threonine-protein kinase BUR1 [Saccharomycodes ludwigii]|uniref:Serine/threonine-protein kinase BUR1 n=1 Tax=Saccharomycodes ludwigii TaxID=36035 RepID=A0A376B9M0_9ASCO|nr:hypothetical protein SCDLUD_000045 [Saccharomycodes ludwigii]KAH3902468.1 hypothetical protein SCDLUD_000045 [Saccharomycodes ludwigii]SSD61378.1 related to Serine/threonine-protein kinase BUR1 [Saccharomycodes ludwigii]